VSVSWQQIPVHMGQGVDTKTDAKLVQAGKLLRCQDAIQVAAQQWRKRNGYQKITRKHPGRRNDYLAQDDGVIQRRARLRCRREALQLFSYASGLGG
jgi:hypothetical protein